MDDTGATLREILGLMFRAHPWHGIPIGPEAPEVVNVYVEIVPTDTVKYELDKDTGILKVDRPQKYSNVCPTLYGFIPQTLCAEQVAERSIQRTGRDDIIGDDDPLDICVLTEKHFTHGDFLLHAIPIGGFRLTYGSIIMLALFGYFYYALRQTAWGKHVYATGDDIEAARLAGIRTGRVLFSVYLVAGLVYAIGAWILIGRLASASPNVGIEYNLDSITAVVLGGTSLFGGRGLVLGTLVGALIVGVFRNGLQLGGVDVVWQGFAIGLLVLVAVSIDQWIRKVRA